MCGMTFDIKHVPAVRYLAKRKLQLEDALFEAMMAEAETKAIEAERAEVIAAMECLRS